jgi:hypothetical protein
LGTSGRKVDAENRFLASAHGSPRKCRQFRPTVYHLEHNTGLGRGGIFAIQRGPHVPCSRMHAQSILHSFQGSFGKQKHERST